jgi:hypothetical protein
MPLVIYITVLTALKVLRALTVSRQQVIKLNTRH